MRLFDNRGLITDHEAVKYTLLTLYLLLVTDSLNYWKTRIRYLLHCRNRSLLIHDNSYCETILKWVESYLLTTTTDLNQPLEHRHAWNGSWRDQGPPMSWVFCHRHLYPMQIQSQRLRAQRRHIRQPNPSMQDLQQETIPQVWRET